MKNLTDHRDEPSALRVPRSGGHDPFRFRKIATYDRQKKRSEKEWRRHEPEEYRLASLRKLILGRIPGRAAKYGCADFDLSDEAEYAGDDGVAVKGSELAGIAAHIVRCAKHPVDYLFLLRNVPAKLVEPVKAYLRVKLAMGRLRAEVEAVQDNLPLSSRTSEARSGTSRGQDDVEGEGHLNATLSATSRRSRGVFVFPEETLNQARDDRKLLRHSTGAKPAKSKPSFKWHTSPAKTHNFKTLTERCGYDPRETSVYWIEKRANALRRKWKKHGQKIRGESLVPKPKTQPKTAPLQDKNTASKIKYFTPADIDYNSVWPPVKMPAAPPREADVARETVAETVLESKFEKEIIENGSATLQQDSFAFEVPAFTVCEQTAYRDDNSSTFEKYNNLSSPRSAEKTSMILQGQDSDGKTEPLNTRVISASQGVSEASIICPAKRREGNVNTAIAALLSAACVGGGSSKRNPSHETDDRDDKNCQLLDKAQDYPQDPSFFNASGSIASCCAHAFSGKTIDDDPKLNPTITLRREGPGHKDAFPLIAPIYNKV